MSISKGTVGAINEIRIAVNLIDARVVSVPITLA